MTIFLLDQFVVLFSYVVFRIFYPIARKQYHALAITANSNLNPAYFIAWICAYD